MRYLEFKTAIQRQLQKQHCGATWNELCVSLALPYKRPCPEWTNRLEQEIGLVRRKGSGRGLVWLLCSSPTPPSHV